MTGFMKFPSIESFAHVYKGWERSGYHGPVKVYGAKVKLHGTNAGVRIEDGVVYAQSRSRDITPEEDNAGFAAWVEETKDAWTLGTGVVEEPVVYFGEWAGKGIQKGDAVTQLDRKYFFVFAVQIGDRMHTDPEWIETAIPDLDNVLVLPWYFTGHVDFSDVAGLTAWLDALNDEAESIGERDPFIADVFGVEGPGEGLVLMPAVPTDMPHGFGGVARADFRDHTFKVKAPRHAAKKTQKAAAKEIEVPEDVKEFVDAFVTDARCEQGLEEACDGVAEKPRTANFLKWIGQDVKKESAEELEAMGLSWKDVTQHVTRAAVNWFMDRCGRIPGVA